MRVVRPDIPVMICDISVVVAWCGPNEVDGVTLLETPDNSAWPSLQQRTSHSFVTHPSNTTQHRTMDHQEQKHKKNNFVNNKVGKCLLWIKQILKS